MKDGLIAALAGAAKSRSLLPEPRYPATIRLPRQLLSVSEAMARREVELPEKITRAASAGSLANIMLYSVAPETLVGWSSRVVSSCPPGIPMLVPGEEITAQTVRFLQSSGIESIFVVR